MPEANRAISLGVISLVAIAIILILGFGLFLNATFKTATSTTTSSTTPSVTNAVSSASGLNLSATINATNIAVGQSVNITMSIFNTLPNVNSVPASSDFAFQGVPVAVWPPCYFSVPMQVVVLNGNYTTQQLPSVANVTIPYICMEGSSIHQVIFQPNSDQANLTGTYSVTGANQTLGSFGLRLNFTTSGYWDLQNLSKELNTPILGQQNPPRPPSSIAFVPGVYTVAVEDEWGQIVLLHFTVSQVSPDPVQVISAIGPIPPFNPGGPVISVTLKNVGSGYS